MVIYREAFSRFYDLGHRFGRCNVRRGCLAQKSYVSGKGFQMLPYCNGILPAYDVVYYFVAWDTPA